MLSPFPRTRIAAAVGGFVMLLGAGQALGAGFALQENSGSGLGNAYAGGAAAAEDASTIWSNPAGMSEIKTNQAVAAINLIQPSMKFSNGASKAAFNQPLGDNGGDAGSLNVVPNMYVLVPINKQWTFGLGVNAPFGLVTEYDDLFIGRYQGIKSDVKTININPALSWAITPDFTLGFGANYQQLKGTFTSDINYSGALMTGATLSKLFTPTELGQLALSTGGLNSFANVTGDDYSWGWNVGVLWKPDKDSRIGVAWRSDIKYSLTGNADISNPALPSTIPAELKSRAALVAASLNNTALASSGITSDIKLPGIANVSYFRTLNPAWDIMFDVQWTHWSTIPSLTFYRTSNTVTPLVDTPLQFKDAWRFALGANYRYSDQWMFRGGLAYDQTPVQDADRTPRLPDNDRTWLSLGVQYKMDKAWKFDLGATYIWVKNASINNAGNDPATDQPNSAAYGLINGTYNNNVAIVSGQVTWSF